MKLLVAMIATASVGAVVAVVTAVRALASPPRWSLRTNVSGRTVPAVLGACLAGGGTIAISAAAIARSTEWAGGAVRAELAALVVLVLLGAAGLWDDSRGDEAPRGFTGHLSARRLTGGIVKIVAGAVAGVAAAALLSADDLGTAALTALAVPLSANLFNLLDRAPGRTGKTALLLGVPLLAFGDEAWAIAAVGTFGALAVLLPADLGERGMLGDAGSNPLGGLVGLGLAASLDVVPLTGVVLVLLALNAASERWSFSDVIGRTPPLRAFDSIGRK